MTQISDDQWKNSDIVDNNHVTLKEAFSERARLADKEICMATGYLYLSGLLEVIRSFHKDAKMRIIMGDETDKETADELEASYRVRCERILSSDLDSVHEDDERLETLHEMISSGKLQVRIYKKSRFHAKAYIFARQHADDDKAIIGSSNLTRPGLHSNTELNVVHKATSGMHLLKSWFDEKWDEAESFDRSLLRLIDESGKRLGTPKDFVSARRLIQEVASEILRTYGSIVLEPPRSKDPLAMFQMEGAMMLEATMGRFGGAILSDSVGLGKTFVGMRVIENFMHANPSSRVLLIAPRGAISNWKRLIRGKKFIVDPNKITIRSTTELSNYDTEEATDRAELARMSKCGLVVIDEAHRFRTRNRKNRKNLDLVGIRGKKALLITATAVNNSASDLKSIIEIFSDGTALLNHDRNMDLESFERYDRHKRDPEPDYGRLEQIKSQMSSILQAVMVQRTRVHVEGQIVDGKRLQFSNPTVHKHQSVDLGSAFFEAFEALLSRITLPHMYIVSDRKTHVDALYRIMLYKRLESSLAALDKSLERLTRSQKSLLDAMGSSDPNVAIENWWKQNRKTGVDEGNLDDHDDELVGSVTQRIRDMGEDELRDLKIGLERDITAVRDFVATHLENKRLADGLYLDPKADTLKEVMARLSGRKVLIFTQSADTAEWLDRVMADAGYGSYGVVTGQTDSETREDLIGRFSPRSSNRHDLEGTPREIFVLVATDTLAEAVNLQDSSNIVNFDLPWNPMVLVQRVGRVDRIGNIAPTHVHNIMPGGALEHFLNLVGKLRAKINGVMDTVGKEFQILSGDEVINPKKFEQISRHKLKQIVQEHSAYTGDVSAAVSAVEPRGRVTDDMALPARELLARHGLRALQEVPSNTICAALRTPTRQYIVSAMYRIYDKTTGMPLSNIVVSITASDEGVEGVPEASGEDSGGWLSTFDLINHGSTTRLAPPSVTSRELLYKLCAWFRVTQLEEQKARYSRPGRKLSRVERELLSRIHDDAETHGVLESADFRGILSSITGIRLTDPLCEWIRTNGEEEVRRVSREMARQLRENPGFVMPRHSGDIGHRLICWCAREPI